jgi:DNA-binding response OmpR family regulator/EAL domain-containing protein (putative c-di-GMP-specific phosphodiesterase class I)
MRPDDQAVTGEKSLRVLLVEDDSSARDFLVAQLEQAGMIVRALPASAPALEQLAGFAPDLMLVSCDGEASELLSAVRRQRELAFLPVILLSAVDDQQLRFAAIASGADDFLATPVATEILLAAIHARILRVRMMHGQSRVPMDAARRRGQLRRGEFLAQLGAALRSEAGPWQVLAALRLDQSPKLAESLGQARAFDLEQAIAARFATVLQEDDAYTLWMPFGFGILAQRGSRAEIETLAQALCARVADSAFEIGGEELKLTLSVGLALAPAGADSGDPDRWFASAYAAQAIAHRLGGDRFDGVLSREHGSMPPERVLIIREWVKEAVAGDNILIEFQPVLPLRDELAGLYALDAMLRDYRAPLAGVRRKEYLSLAREAGALPMIDRMSLFSAFEALEEERGRGRQTRVLVAVDLATINDAQLRWLDGELRRRKAHSDGLIIEFDADVALGRPELVRVVQRLEDQGVVIAIADESGNLERIRQLQRFPAGMLRLPLSAVDSVPAPTFAQLLGPWQASGRGLIVDRVDRVEVVARLWGMQIGYVQGDALAAAGPRLDYEFRQFGV